MSSRKQPGFIRTAKVEDPISRPRLSDSEMVASWAGKSASSVAARTGNRS